METTIVPRFVKIPAWIRGMFMRYMGVLLGLGGEVNRLRVDWWDVGQCRGGRSSSS